VVVRCHEQIGPVGQRGLEHERKTKRTVAMSRIVIVDLEVFYCVGLTDEERAKPQRLLLTVDMNLDFDSAAISDRVEKTVNYQSVADELLKFGDGRSWKLLEKLVTNIAETILIKYKPQSVAVEAKKFIIPQARYVAVSTTKARPR
jgi:7,8-dihydroneopterin aldolase/epimerase/oxygenase